MIVKVAKAARFFDVVYANTAKALIIGGFSARLARRPLVFHLHDIVSGGHFSTINRQALVVTANLCATSVIANSEATKSAFIASGGNAKRCVVIPNGFDLSKENLTDDGSLTLREDLGITDETWIVLMAGRLSHWKGQHVLLEALKQVPGAHAILLGDALFTKEDRDYAQQLHKTASEPELSGRVHFAGFQLVTAPFFSTADVVVHASIFPEPFGRVIVEGMLAGKPVIATRAGGAAEIVEDGRTGLLVRTGDVDELKEALVRLKSQPEFAVRLAEAAEREARETYSLIGVKAQIESVIRLAAHPPRKPEDQCLVGSSVDEVCSVSAPIN
jgi:glycosyltransferase involved in cell wall biosynthesis